jgi:hypothetical protein
MSTLRLGLLLPSVALRPGLLAQTVCVLESRQTMAAKYKAYAWQAANHRGDAVVEQVGRTGPGGSIALKRMAIDVPDPARPGVGGARTPTDHEDPDGGHCG